MSCGAQFQSNPIAETTMPIDRRILIRDALACACCVKAGIAVAWEVGRLRATVRAG